MLGGVCRIGSRLLGRESENRIFEAWLPRRSGGEYIGHEALYRLLGELRLTNVCLIGGQMTCLEIQSIAHETNRRPSVIYGFDPVEDRWSAYNIQRAEIGFRVGIIGTSVGTEVCRQVIIIRSKKYCFFDDRRNLGQASRAYLNVCGPPPARSSRDRKSSARLVAQVASEALMDESVEGSKEWVEEVMSKKDYERMKLRDEVMESVAPEDWLPGDSLRHEWFKAQRLDPKFTALIEKAGKDMPSGHRLAEDGLIERCVSVAGGPTWVPYIPTGEAAVNVSWRRWCFLMCHGAVRRSQADRPDP